MKITLEIKNLSDWEILLPLLKRLKIKVLNQPVLEKKEPQNNILKFAGILSEKEAVVFESAILESRKIDTREW